MSDKAKKITAAIIVVILLLALGAGAFYFCYIEKIDVSIGSSNQPVEGPILMEIGDKILVAPLFPDKIYISKAVEYSSKDDQIASVNKAGEITAMKVGSTTITLTTVLFRREATVEVHVSPGMPDEVIVTANENNKQYIDETKDENQELEEVTFTAKTKRKGLDSYDPVNTKFMWSIWDVQDPDNHITLLDRVITDGNEIKYKPKNKFQNLSIVCTIVYNDRGITRLPAKSESTASVFKKVASEDFEIIAQDNLNTNIVEGSTIEMGKDLRFGLYFTNPQVDREVKKEFYYSVNSSTFTKVTGELLLEELGTYTIKVKVTELGNTLEKEFSFNTKYAKVTNITLDKTKEIRPISNVTGFTLTAKWDRFADPNQEVTFNIIGYDKFNTKRVYPVIINGKNEAFINVGANKNEVKKEVTFSVNGDIIPDILIDIENPYPLQIIVSIGECKSELFEYTLASKEVKNIKIFANLDNDFNTGNIKQKSDETIGANRIGQTVYLSAKNYPLDSFVNVRWYVNGQAVVNGVQGNSIKIDCENIGEYHVYCTDQEGNVKSNVITIPSVNNDKNGILSSKIDEKHFDYLGDYNGRSVNTYITSQSDLDSFVEYSILTDGKNQEKTTSVYIDTCMQSIWDKLSDTDIYTGELFWIYDNTGYHYVDKQGNKINKATPIDPVTREQNGSVARSFYRLNYSGNFSASVIGYNVLNKNFNLSISSPTDVPTVQSNNGERPQKIKNSGFGYSDAVFPFEEIKNNTRHFAIDDIEQTVTVSTSSQLYDAVENGYRPVCVPGSNADYIYKDARKVLTTYLHDNDSDFVKVKLINDWIVHFVTYDYAAADYDPVDPSNINDSLKFSAFFLEGVFSIPGFTDRVAVCDGRSKAFTLMCSIEGIKSLRITGSVNGREGHAWNKVYIETPKNSMPAWYIVDTTWNDAVARNDAYEVTNYNYFLCSDKTHNYDKNYKEDRKVGGIPPATIDYATF